MPLEAGETGNITFEYEVDPLMEELTKIECEKDGERWEEIRVKEYFIAGFNLKTCKFIAIMINMNLNLLLNYVHKDCPDGSSKDGHLQEMVKFRCWV